MGSEILCIMQIPSKFKKPYNPKKTERRIYRLWEKSGYFNPDKLKTKKSPYRRKQRSKNYCIVIPPPNITGSLHMGHALNSFIQDILVRTKRMQGCKTLWVPGTDHAGIATQNVVEKELKKVNLTRFDLGREKFIKEVWKWKRKYGNIILNQLKKIGCSCDWSRKRFTLDKNYIKAVNEAFLHYYKKGWIYRGERLINWCPRCKTSLSDLELEYKEEKTNLWYIKYPLAKSSKYIVVATTRPETMIGDTAVAVNPQDKRYKNLIGKKVILPLTNRNIPIIADKLVDMEFGTGAVKVTPAHDPVDFEIAQRHKLPILKIIDEEGKMTGEIPKKYKGIYINECRKKIINDLQKENLLEKIEPYAHKIPICYRCGTVIQPLINKQWFLKMDKLAQMAKKAVKQRKIKFYPKKWEKIYFDWLNNIKDWCISRQIWWGHRLPIWQCQMNSKEKYFLSFKKPKKCPICGKCKPEQIPDVLDTWFSSALWPFAVLGWPFKTKDMKNFYPTDVLVTARDIINLWVARMIFSSLELIRKIPFRDVIIHATILTKEGKRMSKSKGTGIDPLELVDEYGADAVRFGLIYQYTDLQDIRFSEENIKMAQKFCNKIWNATRFVLMSEPSRICTNIEYLYKPTKIKNLTSADKKILQQLKTTIKKVNKDIENYRFGKAAHILYDFFWHKFCDKYIEVSKKQNTKETKEILGYVLLTLLKLLHPFMPFLTEEIYQNLPLKKKELLMIEKWPET